uniref:Calponin-homology (CH) domain-containing protein n=2 Tax=Meloidogyne incognita TaxID=6306 RepID=A0A914L6F5_MELIC
MSIPNFHHLKSDNSTKQLQTSPVGFSNVSRSSTFHYCFSPPTLNNESSSNSLINNKSPVIPICDISSIKTNSFKSTPSSDDSYNKNTVESSSNHQMQKNVLHSTYAEAIESECLEHYEINLERYKDERDAIQKKTFTKWVNQHLSKTNKTVEDLFFDLRDGRNLIDLLELLSAENLSRENGRTRFHRIQNVQSCLEFLRRRNIRLVNIRPEDIVDGNGKLTLGLIWTIILNFQVSAVINYQQKAQRRQDITVHISATTSPNNKIINSQQDEGVHYSQTTSRLVGSQQQLRRTEEFHERSRSRGGDYRNGYSGRFGAENGSLPRGAVTERRNFYDAATGAHGFSENSSWETREHFERKVQKGGQKAAAGTLGSRARLDQWGSGSGLAIERVHDSSILQRERETSSPEPSFSSEARTTTSARDALLAWARRVISTYHPEVDVQNFSSNWRNGFAFDAILHYYRPELVNWEKVLQLSARERLQFAFDTFESEYGIAKLLDPEDVCDVETPDERSLITYVSMLHNRLINEPKGGYDDVISRLTRGIGITNEKLDHLLVRIDNVNVAEERGERFEILERQVREIVDDLHLLKPPIDELFSDVEILRQQRHSQTADLNKQVVGLEQRRAAYLGRLEDGIMTRLGIRPKAQFVTERVTSTTTADGGSLAYKGNAFRRVEDAIQWIRDRTDFRQTVDECIARQAEVSAEDSYDYFELLKILESEYQQLRELSAGRMVDLDSLIAFIRAAQLELVWIHEREELEVTRNWSTVQQLDIPMLQNYFKQVLKELFKLKIIVKLLHEIELHEKQFNDVHNQGAALINQRHPAGEVIEVYLRTMQNQWDWLLNLSKCLEGHLRDAYNAKSFLEESDQIEQQMQQQLNHLDQSYNRTDFSLDEGERMLRELDSIREHIQQLHARLLSLSERCSQISPLWQRGERIGRPIPIVSLCEYKSKESHVRQGNLKSRYSFINF